MMKSIVILAILFVAFCFVTSILIYLFNRSKYQLLIHSFIEKYPLPAPYSFHAQTGYFGSIAMSNFFIRLKKKKKIRFLEQQSAAYDFFDKNNIRLPGWMPVFYGIFMSGLLCALCLMGLAVLIKMNVLS